MSPEHKKDPGIPSNFPYKERILEELAEERRKKEEERELRKAAKKDKKPQASTSDSEDDEDAVDGVSTFSAGAASKQATSKAPAPQQSDDESSLARRSDLKCLKSVLEQADVVIHLLDARDPEGGRSSSLEEGKCLKDGAKTLFVLNKIGISLVLWIKRPTDAMNILRYVPSRNRPGMGHSASTGTSDFSVPECICIPR